ncbi:sporulation protein YqfD [Bacillus fengqiuensis]|nr:sporulation protein YqfD [Bacillus fengqiuensis]
MKNQWIEFCFGVLTVKLTGKGNERFINHLTRNELLIWGIKRHDAETLTFKMSLRDLKRMRILARESESKVEFLHGSGAPFLLKRIGKNSGFVVGIFLFFVSAIFLSNIIWGIEIKGASPATEYQLKKELNEMGIKIGKPQFLVPAPESI